MGWVTDDGLHEGYLAAQFFDGQRAAGVTSASIPDAELAVGAQLQDPDGTWRYPTRPAGEVTGWVVCCNCSSPGPARTTTTWIGPSFTRVPSQALEDLGSRHIFAPDADVAYVSEREDVELAARDLWHAEHAFATDALAAVESAAAAATKARDALDASVMFARQGGASWAAIGRATGMTRQSAQERWRGVSEGLE